MVNMLDHPQEQGGRQRQYGVEPHIHYMFFEGETMDTQQSRIGLPANRFAWLENLQPIGKNNLFQVPGPGTAIATIPGGLTTKRQYYANFGGHDYAVHFMTDGSGWTVDLATGVFVNFALAGTFTNPDMAQWASDRIVIADPSAQYCQYDGTVFNRAGSVSPHIVITNGGSGYSLGTTATITGGSGSGTATLVTVVNGVVTSVQLTQPGVNYKAGDVLTVVFSGTGTNAAATAIVWPIFTITNLSTIAVFQGRVWMAGNRTFQWTGTNGFDDVSAANGAGSLILSDSDLPHQITALRALNNFLFIFGDGSVKQIGSISVSAGVTLFTILTLTSDQGTIFPQSIVAYDRLVMFANFFGVYAIFGATIEKISDPMDGLYNTVDFSLQPVSLVTNVNNINTLLVMVRINDPVYGLRTVFMSFFGKKWYLISQGVGSIVSSILSACDATIGGVSKIFVSSGTDVTQILSLTTLNILVRTALSEDRKPYMNKRGIRCSVAQSSPIAGTITLMNDTESTSITDQYSTAVSIVWLNASGGVVTWVNAASGLVTFIAAGFKYQPRQFAGTGIYLGLTLTGSFQKFILNSIIVEYEDGTVMRSINHQ
jgi:hypothetical protein